MYTAIRKSLNKENDKGFTLIELLVVIIIIGILAAIAIPIFLSQRKKGFEASQKSDARTLATQMETWFTDSQAYPAPADVSRASATAPVVFGPSGEQVFLSPNNTAQIFVATGGSSFCVLVGSSSTDNTAVYDSASGGLKGMVADAAGTAAACTGGTYAATPVDLVAP